jgi:two-component system, NtrC family, response regulator
MARILIIDDEPSLCEYLSDLFRDANHEVFFVHTLKDGINFLSQDSFDAVFLDVGLPDGNGLSGLRQMRDVPSSPEIIIITGLANRAEAEIAIKNGAWDYIQKPFTTSQIIDCLSSVLQYQRERASRPSSGKVVHRDIIGTSSQIKRCLAQLAPAAFSDASVLITGETGTGKELFAQAIHDNSLRKSNNFVIVDCASLPEPLVESTLFGHQKGAFTSADQSQEGLIKQAHNGTLFLDEVGELPLSVQKSFLRVLQEHRFRPVGSQHEIESNFKLITATNQDLDQMVQRGIFRRDLLFRLRSIAIDLPPLRERTGDIEIMTTHYLKKLSTRYQIKEKKISPDFIEVVTNYPWPGNIRELINALEKSISMAQGCPTLFSMHLPTNIRIQVVQSAVDPAKEYLNPQRFQTDDAKPMPNLKKLLAAAEKKYLQRLVSHTSGDVKKICWISGLSRSRVYERLKKYDLSLHT